MVGWCHWKTLDLRWASVHIHGILSGCIYRVGKTCPLWVVSFSGILYCRRKGSWVKYVFVAVCFSTENEMLATASKSCCQLDSLLLWWQWNELWARSCVSLKLLLSEQEEKKLRPLGGTLLPNCIPSPTTARTLKLQYIPRGKKLQSGVYVLVRIFPFTVLYFCFVCYISHKRFQRSQGCSWRWSSPHSSCLPASVTISLWCLDQCLQW